jgi:hypothetical protein
MPVECCKILILFHFEQHGSDSGGSTTKEDDEEDLNMDEMMGVQPKQEKTTPTSVSPQTRNNMEHNTHDYSCSQDTLPEEETEMDESMEDSPPTLSSSMTSSEPIPIRYLLRIYILSAS